MTSRSTSNSLRSKRRYVLAFALIAVIGLACAWLAYPHIDQAVVDAEKQWTEHPAWQVALTLGMWLGNWQLAPLIVVLICIAARPYWRRLLKTLVAAYLLSMAVVEWLKLLVGRPRPRVLADATVFEGFAEGSSFPSGHATFAFMMATVIAAWFPRWKWPAWIVAAFVAASRVLVNAHFVSDVIVGAVTGTLAAAVVLWFWPPVTDENREEIEERQRKKESSPERRTAEARDAERRLALRVLTVVLFIAVALLAYWFIDPIPGFFENAFFQHPWVIAVAKAGRLLGTWELAPILIAMALIAAGSLWKELLVSLLGGYIVQSTVTELIKDFVGRPRPSQIPAPDLFLGPGTRYASFVSGHASFIFMFAVICSAYIPRARVPLYVLAAFVAASRVVLCAHYISDVTIGALIGVLTGWLVLAIWRPPKTRKHSADDG